MTSLVQALGLGRGDVVAVAGAGGKTTLVYRLAAEAREAGLRVLVTSTTHMGVLPEAVTGPLFLEAEGDLAPHIAKVMRETGYATVLGLALRSDKIEGISAERVAALARLADLVLIEADGARGRSLKVPAAHEPVIPTSTTVLVVVAALDVLGEPLDESRVHRIELVAAATGLRAGETIGEDAVVAALTHAEGYPARVAAGMRSAVFLNKVEDDARRNAAARIASRLLPPYHAVAAGSARGGELTRFVSAPGRMNHGALAGIVLAAGSSSRMGRPKMLLPMDGGTLVSVVSRALLDAGLPVVVVLGHDAERVRREAGLPEGGRVRIVVNEDWPSGMASSLRAGLDACPDAEAVLVALGDQPGITADRVRRIVAAWRPGGSLVLPVHQGRAGHPVLFGRRLFGELRALRGDVGGREVVRRHLADAARVEAEPLADLDTAEDLRRHQAGLPPPDNGLDLAGSTRRTGRH